jgi:hypothetical protein
MEVEGVPNPAATLAPAARPPPDPAWRIFHRSVEESLLRRPVAPLPEAEDTSNVTVRAMQRARRRTWLHARYLLGWSMFEAIRLSARLAEAFAAWTRGARPDVARLGRELERVETEMREPASLRERIRFLDHLLDAVARDRNRDEMALALEAFGRTEPPARKAAGS